MINDASVIFANIGSTNGLLHSSTKPLSAVMLPCHGKDSEKCILMHLQQKYSSYQWPRYISRWCFQNDNHFTRGPMDQWCHYYWLLKFRQGPGLLRYMYTMLKPMIINKDFRTWLLIGWQHAASQSETMFESACWLSWNSTWICLSNPGLLLFDMDLGQGKCVWT